MSRRGSEKKPLENESKTLQKKFDWTCQSRWGRSDQHQHHDSALIPLIEKYFPLSLPCCHFHHHHLQHCWHVINLTILLASLGRGNRVILAVRHIPSKVVNAGRHHGEFSEGDVGLDLDISEFRVQDPPLAFDLRKMRWDEVMVMVVAHFPQGVLFREQWSCKFWWYYSYSKQSWAKAAPDKTKEVKEKRSIF